MYLCGWLNCVLYVTPYRYEDADVIAGTTPSAVTRYVMSGAFAAPNVPLYPAMRSGW